MLQKITFYVTCLIGLSLLGTACVSTDEADKAPVPISNAITAQASNSALTYYTVQSGDTLYAIASKFGLSYQRLATLNQLQKPFALHVGQWICLKATCAQTVKKTAEVTKPAPRSNTRSGNASAVHNAPAKTIPAAKTNSASHFNGHFQWPATGPLLNGQASHSKGIDILGVKNAPVLAAAAGKVVYAGDRLRGYGRLVIIKHNAIYLTAYAHNNKILVKEGQFVKAGQVIAKMGDTDAKRVQLHFEIRKHGRPVDPLAYLPKK